MPPKPVKTSTGKTVKPKTLTNLIEDKMDESDTGSQVSTTTELPENPNEILLTPSAKDKRAKKLVEKENLRKKYRELENQLKSMGK